MLLYLKDFVELRTKVASIIPLMYTIVIYLFLSGTDNFNIGITIIFIISMLCLDMATTALNHLAGFTTEKEISMYDQELLQRMNRLGITHKFNKAVIIILLTCGIILGLVIVLNSNIFVLLIGMLCVLVALLYSYGPLPLKNTCLGEVASGVTLGALVPLAYLFSQDSQMFIETLNFEVLIINIPAVITWAVILIIPVMVVANIMLANNICDVHKDSQSGRRTLPILFGKPISLLLWMFGYVIVYIDVLGLVIFQKLPTLALLALLTMPIVLRNTRRFISNPVKSQTFKYAVFNLQIILLSIGLAVLIDIILN
ncbi:prenyltransferase [Mollicutes bacterium LVI A0039]|nr:prenyltransferase [Mollicutes bacterium LVI A0039]